ncbi:MAG: DUF374 domain-containing protein [Actinobacteria bacterium]|nr:DUF374 domain-containing protein [Actinomycetota bacterium]
MKKTKKEIISYLAAKLAWLLILFLGKTGRINIVNKIYFFRVRSSGKPFIIVTWHGRMLVPIYIHRNMGFIAMVSEHGDGEMIAQTILRLGYKTVRGSTTRGGSRVVRKMLKVLKNGNNCAILPDGPNGPRHEFKMGAILIAQRSQAWLLPCTFSASKPIQLHSWDRFTLWRPFSKLQAVYGEPMAIPRKINPHELEQYRVKMENRMNALVEEADATFRK